MTGDSYVERLLAETREELLRADSKASILLAAAGVIVGAVVSAVASAKLDPFDVDWRVQWLMWTGIASVLVGVACLGMAVWPRVGKATPGRADYFVDIAEFATPSALEMVLLDTTPVERDARQLHALARHAVRKYRYTRWGVLLFAAGVIQGGAAMLVQTLLVR